MSSVLFLFLAHLAVGIAAALLLVGQAAGVKFFRFNAGLAAILLLSALAFRPDPPAGAPAAAFGFGALLVATGALLVYWATIGRALARLRPLLLWTTALGGAGPRWWRRRRAGRWSRRGRPRGSPPPASSRRRRCSGEAARR